MTAESNPTAIRFPVSVAGEPTARLAECRFAREDDLEVIAGWQEDVRPGEPMPVQDAAEYAGAAASKRRFYAEAGRVANAIADVKRTTARHPEAELSVLLVAALVEAPPWGRRPPQLAFCHVRRTWVNNLYIDYLANAPFLLRSGAPRVRGLATGLLYAVMTLGEQIGAGRVWGEATDQSANFYCRQFRVMEIRDEFNLDPAEQWHFVEKTRQQWSRFGLSLNLRFPESP